LGRLEGVGGWYAVEEAKLLGELREGDTVDRGGEERAEEGVARWGAGSWGECRDCLAGMVLGEELFRSSWCLADCFCPDGVLGCLGVVFKF
jgi:hypothetical protein